MTEAPLLDMTGTPARRSGVGAGSSRTSRVRDEEKVDKKIVIYAQNKTKSTF